MRLAAIIILICLLNITSGYSKTVADTNSVVFWIQKASDTLPNKPEKALIYAQKALNKSKNQKKGNLEAYAHISCGNVYQKLGLSIKAYKSYHIAKDILIKNKDLNGLALCCKQTGFAYFFYDNYQESINFFFDAAELYTNLKNLKAASAMYAQIGLTYEKLKNYEEAIYYTENAYEIIKNEDNYDLKVKYLTYIGKIYNQIKLYNKAKDCITKSFEILEKTNDSLEIATAYVYLGQSYAGLQKWNEAKESFYTSMSICKKYPSDETYLLNFEGLGSLYFKNNDNKNAEKYANQLLDLSIKTKNMFFKKKSLEILFEIKKKQKETDKALNYLEALNATKDSIYQQEKQNEMSNFEIQKERSEIIALKKMEMQQKEKIDNDITQRNTLVLVLSLMCGFAIYLVYSFSRQQKTNKELSLKNIKIEEQRNNLQNLNENIKKVNDKLKITLDLVEIEKAKSDKLLLNILPDTIAQELKKHGSAIPKHYDNVTILFTDFVGFTNISEKLSANELIRILDKYFNAFDEICAKNGLEKIKTIGDAFMAAGGLPEENKTHPFNAIDTALEILDFVKKDLNDGWQIRIGIHTGPVTAGVIGKHKFAYDVWGDTVNMAARMEQSGEKWKINISQTTYNLISSKYNCTHRGMIAAKNKGEIDMYFVENKI